MGDSFLWEGSLFVFQYVGGDGRGHILSQGPQLKISIHKQGGFANLGETIRDERAEKAAEDRSGKSSSSAAAASRPTEYPVSDPPTPEESDSEVTDYDSLPPVPVYDHDTGVRHHDHDTESEKKKKKKNN